MLLQLPLLLSSCLALPFDARAQADEVRRCVAADGSLIFTDRRCEDVGATTRQPARAIGPSQAGTGSRYVRGCPRTLHDLTHEMGLAIQAQDVNRLAGVYLWTGISNTAARSIMARLQDVVRRPLLDIAPVLPPAPVLDADGSVADANGDGYYPRTTQRRRPIALRLEQTLTDGSTPSRSVFGISRSHGCYWIDG